MEKRISFQNPLQEKWSRIPPPPHHPSQAHPVQDPPWLKGSEISFTLPSIHPLGEIGGITYTTCCGESKAINLVARAASVKSATMILILVVLLACRSSWNAYDGGMLSKKKLPTKKKKDVNQRERTEPGSASARSAENSGARPASPWTGRVG